MIILHQGAVLTFGSTVHVDGLWRINQLYISCSAINTKWQIFTNHNYQKHDKYLLPACSVSVEHFVHLIRQSNIYIFNCIPVQTFIVVLYLVYTSDLQTHLMYRSLWNITCYTVPTPNTLHITFILPALPGVKTTGYNLSRSSLIVLYGFNRIFVIHIFRPEL